MNRLPYLPAYSTREARKAFVEREFLLNPSTKITAIKILRAMTGAGLKEAKDMVEETLFREGRGLNFDFVKTPENMVKIAAFFDYNEGDTTEGLFRALSVLKSDWKILGFSSYKQAVETISRNF